MPLDPMPSHCPSCGTQMVPVLTQKPRDPNDGPLSADVPVTVVCPRCTAMD